MSFEVILPFSAPSPTQALVHLERRHGRRLVTELVRVRQYDAATDRFDLVPLAPRVGWPRCVRSRVWRELETGRCFASGVLSTRHPPRGAATRARALVVNARRPRRLRRRASREQPSAPPSYLK